MREIEKIAVVETRVGAVALFDAPNMREPASAMLVSLPPGAVLAVARLHFRTDRLPSAFLNASVFDETLQELLNA